MYTTDGSSDPRYTRFIETRGKHVTIACVKCGSQRLDQNCSTEIMCYDCGNVAPWDSSSFTIVRPWVEHHDVLRAFQLNPV
jgi:ribosomal protein S27E